MSAILSVDTLNDFISPGVACIKPVETLPAKPQSENNEYEVSFNTEAPPADLPPAQISLTDCLACSGCVTSAEAVLVSLQSHAEVLQELDSGPALRLRRDGSGVENLDTGGKIYVASVSPQTRASIAATFKVTESEAGYMIEQLLSGPRGIKGRAVYRNGFQWVVDTNVAREACLVLGADEVTQSMATAEGKSNAAEEGSASKQPKRPILSSSCPGWICYAEKTHPHILPHLSRLKSPQALMGTLLKTTLCQKLGISPDRIWHVAIMPCFDKKLEASREELTDAVWEGPTGARGVRDVDSVITSKELLMLAESRRVDFAKLPRAPIARLPFPDQKLDAFLFPSTKRRKNNVPASGTSGGNLYYVLHNFASQHAGATVQTARGRNADVLEYSVTSSEGEILLKAARYYGFRNIQNLVRRLKPVKPSRMPGGKPIGSARKTAGKATGPEYSYVEVMACPGGCTNGGGQIKVDDPILSGVEASHVRPGPQEQKEWLAQVDEAYFSGEDSADGNVSVSGNDLVDGISPSYIKDTLAYWAATTGLDLGRLVYTSYREVVSDVGKKVGDAERVIEIAGKMGGGW
ncbi:Cytosolic Fe-S cluster assembly factor nar1 [Cadophora gregata]|uniref:Cytosolic Fe-S cluster assembly factor nar1 n=1 Tax=Cadophora gregata TaxID=51156 RepID=UPI0026DBDBDA|nr:Cytosolic Fe-S cluster assembly factor nar1 [Cadophora gregata]KAK0104700.1 Cytosolic Fe-S cluster assembly factor nar1 [Cadophora gregata]KAK0115215.1 Cytosolic Fe-S cluster assembly factor nar1 [Cadophora gregata f. sp. sojae]